jgi:hypothetical protein
MLCAFGHSTCASTATTMMCHRFLMWMRRVMRGLTSSILIAGALTCFVDAYCQETGPREGARSDQHIAAGNIKDLIPLVESLQHALRSNDIEGAYAIAQKLSNALDSARTPSRAALRALAAIEDLLSRHPELRASRAAYAAVAAEHAGEYEKARNYAVEALGYVSTYPQHAAANLFYGNHVLGLVSARRGEFVAAKEHLLASAITKSWPRLAEFGPNMSLAKRLLENGDRETVVTFLDLCRPLWPGGVEKLQEWRAVITAGAKPDFGINLGVLP